MSMLYSSVSGLDLLHPKNKPSSSYRDQLLECCTKAYPLCQSEKQKIFHYLISHELKLNSFGEFVHANIVTAFSFGASDCVNKALAALVDEIVYAQQRINVFAQQEISSHLPHIKHTSIKSSNYQTTEDVVRFVSDNQSSCKVVIVSQAWHAERCIQVCKAFNLDVVGLRVVDYFPENDPQPWVRNPLNWIIKESFRDEATGDEISKRFDLA